jgi:hypothetical protein
MTTYYELPFATHRRDVDTLVVLLQHVMPEHDHTVHDVITEPDSFSVLTSAPREHHDTVQRIVEAWAI